MKKDVVMSKELAQEAIDQWADENGIELDADILGEDTMQTIQPFVARIVRAFMNGALVVNDNGNLVYTVSTLSGEGFAGEHVEIKSPKGDGFIPSGKRKADEIYRLVEITASMTGKDTGWFLKLSGNDFKVFIAVTSLFLIA